MPAWPAWPCRAAGVKQALTAALSCRMLEIHWSSLVSMRTSFVSLFVGWRSLHARQTDQTWNDLQTIIARRAFVWKTFKKWCSFGDVRPEIVVIFAFTNVTWDTETGCYCLLKKLEVLILEPSSLNFLQARLYRLFFNFFQKLQKSPGVVSGGKMRKSDFVDPFPLHKTSKNTIFADENSWHTSDWRYRTSLFKLFHTRAPEGHPCPVGVI